MKIIIKNGILFTGVNKEFIPNETIEIENGFITYIGKPRDTGEDFKMIDAAGKTILPGIIDCHVHLSGSLLGDSVEQILQPNMHQAMVSTIQAKKLLEHGVTTVCDVSWSGIYLKQLINSKFLPGPRIVACGKGLAEGRGGPYVDRSRSFSIEDIKERHPFAIPCDGADNLRHEIRLHKYDGCDAIKVWTTSGGLPVRKGDLDRIYNDEELKAISDEAGMAGMFVVTHTESPEGTKAALKNNILRILHGLEMDDECIRLLKEYNGWFFPTLNLLLGWVDSYTDEELLCRKGIREIEGETLQKKEYNRILLNFMRAYEEGVQIALASDTYSEEMTPYGEYTLNEIKAFVNIAKVPVADALSFSTINAAKALELDDKIGSVEEGKIADIILVNGNVVEDINLLKAENIDTVIKNGKIQ